MLSVREKKLVLYELRRRLVPRRLRRTPVTVVGDDVFLELEPPGWVDITDDGVLYARDISKLRDNSYSVNIAEPDALELVSFWVSLCYRPDPRLCDVKNKR